MRMAARCCLTVGFSLLERFYIGADVERLDIDQRPDAGGVEPGEEIRDRPVIGHAGVLVPI
jgi:hypothetical protein